MSSPAPAPAYIVEKPRRVPVVEEADICVLGGSCTGVFAALRAARLGARVVLVERMGCFGGCATLSLVNVWHSPKDELFEQDIIGGLTLELMARLTRRGAVRHQADSPHWAWAFNPYEMQIELDEMVREAGVIPWLHTAAAAPWVDDDGVLSGVFVESKSGRGVIRARQFIDCTGDGDLCQRLGLETVRNPHIQPPTTCAIFENWEAMAEIDFGAALREHGPKFQLPPGFQWGVHLPDSPLYMLAGTRVVHADLSDAKDLTHAEMEGRRQVRGMMDLLKEQGVNLRLAGLPARIGIRETRHIRAHYRLTGDDLLSGRHFDDAIANGSYRVDIHHQDKPGLTFRYLDGREVISAPGYPNQESRWRPETATNPTYYQVPYRCLLPPGVPNLLMAGRMIDTDVTAHSAVRVMVNMNQTGEAAGVAAWLALQQGIATQEVNPQELRAKLSEGGSIML